MEIKYKVMKKIEVENLGGNCDYFLSLTAMGNEEAPRVNGSVIEMLPVDYETFASISIGEIRNLQLTFSYE